MEQCGAVIRTVLNVAPVLWLQNTCVPTNGFGG